MLWAAFLLGTMSISASATSIAKGPDGDAFYEPPSPLPRGKAGSVISMRPLTGTMVLPSAQSNTLVLYRSVDSKGKIVPVSGTVAVPKGKPPAGGWPVITWTHGTTGLAAICAPSRDTDEGPEHGYIAVIRALLDGFVKNGYAVVASDYVGLGIPGDHPFLQGVPTGRNAIDLLRAARQIEPAIGRRYAVMGHSQGGQVDLFAASLGPSYAPEFTQVGNVAFAPGSQIASRIATVRASSKTELALPYVLYVLISYSHAQSAIDLKRILTPEAISHLPDLYEGCMTRALSQGYWSTAIAKDQFVDKPDLAALLDMARRNEPGLLRIAKPTLIMQGTADVTVLPKDTDTTVQDLCKSGNAVDYRPIPGADHDGSMEKGGADALKWIEARFKGARATSSCGKLPKAGP